MDCGGNNYFMCNYENKNDDRRVLTQRNAARYGKEETVKIPAYYQMIGVNAFQSNIKMKNLLLTNGLQEISTNAFRCSKALREVALPHSIYRVGNGCFAECPSLRVAYLSKGLEEISEDLFREDRRLQKVLFTRDSEIKRIRKKAFYECATLNTILLPPKVETIEDRAFYKCKELKKVRFPKGLKKVGKEAFYFCGLESLELPDTVEMLDEKAFFKCMYLTEVKLPESIRRIEKWVFHGCARLQVLEIRHDPEYIGEWIINKAARIRCYRGSKVAAYCQESGFTVEYIE